MAAKRSGERLVAVTSEEIGPDDWIDFIYLDRRRIARRANDGTWIMLEPGFVLRESAGLVTIERKPDERS